VHYPTESSLIIDGLKKILVLAHQLAALLGFLGWRQRSRQGQTRDSGFKPKARSIEATFLATLRLLSVAWFPR
jgi:hypothetical protein